MDGGNIERVMRRRERGYIWLEKDLRQNIASEGILITICFLTAGFLFRNEMLNFYILAGGYAASIVLCFLLNYRRYRKIYRSFEILSKCMEEFEGGNYNYQSEMGILKEGIQSQVLGKLEALGRTFDTMKRRMTEEKENTKVLVTDISHQLKTPLAGLKMSFELLHDEKISENEKREFLDRAEHEVKKMENLLESLTNLSRLEADMIRIHPVEANIKSTIVNAVNSLYMKAFDKQIEIELSSFDDIIVPHDPKWTSEAFINVLDNAVKYSDPGTAIEISVEPQISYVLIEITDHGIGIPKSEYPKIFQRFYRGKDDRVDQTEGSGVGLYLVRRILEEQGGSVRAVRGRQGGTTFQMTLPKIKYEVRK